MHVLRLIDLLRELAINGTQHLPWGLPPWFYMEPGQRMVRLLFGMTGIYCSFAAECFVTGFYMLCAIRHPN